MEIITFLVLVCLAYIAYAYFRKNSPQARLEGETAVIDHYFKLVMKNVEKDISQWIENLKEVKAGESITLLTESEAQEQLDSYLHEKQDLKALYGAIKVKVDYLLGRTTINSTEIESAMVYIQRCNELLSHRITAFTEHEARKHAHDNQSYESGVAAWKEYVHQRDALLEEFKLKKSS